MEILVDRGVIVIEDKSMDGDSTAMLKLITELTAEYTADGNTIFEKYFHS